MEKFLYFYRKIGDQQGVSAIMIALMLVVLISFAALAIDISHLYVVRNELQNASDSGALAGARVLLDENDTSINTNANQVGYDSATANRSEQEQVEVHWTGGNEGDVQRGHWSFTTKTFTPNSSTTPMQLWDYTTEQLDTDPNFINAVRVRARRQNTPAASFFARILGHENFTLATDSVAYLGFAGTLGPTEADMPIAICRASLIDTQGRYTCSTGRMINSGQSNAHQATSQTGGWTDFCQANTPGCDGTPCQGGTDANTLRRDIFLESGNRPGRCSGLNPHEILLGQNIAMQTGQANSVYDNLRQCWERESGRNRPWTLTLPVIECNNNNVRNCERVVGYVTVNVVWVTGSGNNSCNFSNNNLPPLQMGDWTCSTPSNHSNCWAEFVARFNLRGADSNPAQCLLKTIYFTPDCTPHEPAGRTGGQNFNVRAKYPVLVE